MPARASRRHPHRLDGDLIRLPIVRGRITLRAFSLGDLVAFTDLHTRPDVARYLYWEPRTPEESRAALLRRIDEMAGDPALGGLSLAVTRTADDALLGEVVLRIVAPAHRGGELGFIFHPDHSGRGYAIEAARVVLGVAFGEFGLHRVTGSCDARNVASARLMERLGMRREAHFRSNEYVKDEWCDELVYAILREEWAVR